jgi:DNA-binding NarL/FixJ family response regulator
VAPVRLLIADDDPVMRMLLGAIVDREPGLELAGEAEDAEEAIVLAVRERPDLVLLDVDMPGGGGAHAAREIRARLPSVVVLALSAHAGDGEREAMLSAGAAGYVVKGAPPDEIARVLRDAVRPR